MTLKSQIDDIASSVISLNGDNPVELVSLQEKFEALAEEAVADGLDLVVVQANLCSELAGKMLMRELADHAVAIQEISDCIENVQEEIDRLGSGQSQGAQPATDGNPAAAPADDIDNELLGEWLSTCDGLLGSIEGGVLELESSEESESLLAEIRRHLHTLKGECGVLSLNVAQRLCHQAESKIDNEQKHGRQFPADTVLALVDWVKTYASLLGENPSADPPPHEALESQLAFSDEPTPAASPAPVAVAAEPQREQAPEPEPADAPASSCDPSQPVDFALEGDVDENLSEFICESNEHIASAEKALLDLEQDPSDSENINVVFRAFHTVKGVAGFLNLSPIVRLAHSAEFMLDEARQGTITLNSEYLDLILKSCDMLASLVSALQGQDAPMQIDVDNLIAALDRAVKGAPSSDAPATPQPTPPDNPPAEAPSPAATEPEPKAAPAPPSQPAPPVEPIPENKAQAKREAIRHKADVSVKVNTVRLDNLVTMVGELVIAQQMVLQDQYVQEIKDQRFQRNLGHTGKIIRDLQEVAMSLRMVTVKGTFQKMARLVRDVSMKAGKKIQFRMEGEETELDRTVVEEIGDPLVHIIRNACDHGIETPEEREAAGKPEGGTLTLRAFHQGGSIMIEVEDDGKGLDRDRILKKAIDKGLVSNDRDPASIPDNEVFNLILLPGFSTAEQVTDISGRGVGMDVVRRNIEALRGMLEIDSTPGQGTRFRMALPLTMAIIDGMVVQVGEQRYVIPTLSIEQSYRPTPDEIFTVTGRGEMASVRGSLLPIFRLNKLFDLNGGIDDLTEALLIVLENGDTRCCLVVDQILGQQQVVIKSLGQGIQSQPGVSGGAILGDGRVALIIDVGGLITQATSQQDNSSQFAVRSDS